MKKLFNDNWYFKKLTNGSGSTDWNKADIPHDWHIYDVNNLYEDGEGWYKKIFNYKPSADERAYIRFDGVYMDTTVWVNDKTAGEWKYGYSTFELEITSLLNEGENEIKVRTIFKNPNSRWYSGAGIYRNVWFITKSCSNIVSDGVYISTENTGNGFWNLRVSIETDIAPRDKEKKMHTGYKVYDGSGKCICEAEDAECSQINAPVLWDIENPYMYTLCAGLYADGKLVDTEYVRFGFRTISFTCDNGFYLNGRHVKLKGVCMHHDLGCLGAAVNKHAIRRQIKILKSMGVNAVRTAHNMPAPEFMDIADEEGILVDLEAFDMWERPKTKYDYARFFKEWHSKDVASFVRRDRNHPSVIMWSVGNEIYDTHADERGLEVTRMLMEEVHGHDPLHNAYVTIGSNYMPWENAAKCADVLKLAGYNYAESYYEEHHRLHPDWMIYGSETSSIVQSRGIYHFPASAAILSDDDLQCSSLMNSTTSWGAQNLEKCITDDRDTEYSAGMFVWSGFDYIGEPTPYHTRNSYFGQIDTAGFPKDSYYIYRACWTDYKKSPMIHVFPYWDFNEGQLIDVMVCTNAPKMELFFNGVSMGITDTRINKKELVAKYVIPYQKGELRAAAYDEEGNVIAEDIKRSFGNAESIVLSPDKEIMKADGEDLVFVEITVCDKNGISVENANNRIKVYVTGAGRLIGLDNGDSTDMDSYKGISKRLFSGKLLAVIAAKTVPGDVEIKVTSPGLNDAVMILKAEEAFVEEGISANEYNIPVKGVAESEIPVRKLEICTDVGCFDENTKEADISVRIEPGNSVYSDVKFSVTDDNGVKSNIAEVTQEGLTAHVKALGDGMFRLRCISFNGTDHHDIISQKEFNVSGLGAAYINPYEFVSGSLYSKSKGVLTNGNERGVATPRDHTSYILYENLDFGDTGSDEIDIPIFELENTKLEFEIWEGMPYEKESVRLLNAVYDKPSRWNTYQSEKFRLNKKLKGITSLGFVFTRKAHIKGFSFAKPDMTGEKFYIKDCVNIYGDTFEMTDEAVEKIGNNVSFVYNNLNFGNNGAGKISICGSTPLENNTIHIRFKNGEETVNKIVEFEHSEEYIERVYEMSGISGEYEEVLFIFLPGSNFNFKWFRFL